MFPTAPSLKRVDLSLSLDRDEYRKLLEKRQKRIGELHDEIYHRRIPVVIVYEGWDAGGKGGNIRRLTEKMDPRGYEVIPIAAPNDVEKVHHYLWRFWTEFPKAGHLTIFDRSWYGRVLVERVEGFLLRDRLESCLWRDKRDGGKLLAFRCRRDQVLASDRQGRADEPVQGP